MCCSVRSASEILHVTCAALWGSVVLCGAVCVRVWTLACGAVGRSCALFCVPSADNHLGADGCKAVADALRTNSTITKKTLALRLLLMRRWRQAGPKEKGQ